MDCTCINYVDGHKEIRYGIDPVVNTDGISTYLYSSVPDDKVEEIKKAPIEKVQEILSKLF